MVKPIRNTTEVKMHKLAFFTALSKCFGYMTWAASNAVTLVTKVSQKTIDTFNPAERYDVEIFNKDDQIDKRENISHSQLIKLIKSIDVFPSLSLIVSKRNDI